MFFLLCPIGIYAQSTVSSPYSRFGIGDIVPEGFASQIGMAGIGAGVYSPHFINIANPASYIADTSTLFDIGLKGERRTLKSQSGSSKLGGATFSHFALAFPIKKHKISAAFGLIPYSTVGYNLVDIKKKDNIGDVRYEYEGKGGFNRLFVGSGLKISKRLNAGLNVSYLFGTIDQIRNVEYPSGLFYFNTRYLNGVTARGFYLTYGLQYDLGNRGGLNWRAGLAGSIPTKVSAENNIFYYNYSISPVSGGELVKDSVLNEQTNFGSIRLPQYLRGGITVSKGKSWLLGADFTYYDWKKLDYFDVEDPLANNYVFCLGAEKNFEKAAIRTGLKYGKSYVQIDEKDVNEYGVTFGLSLKKGGVKRPPTIISMGLEIGQRGSIDKTVIEDSYIKLNLGITLSDIWFIQPRYD
ncbi:MAG: hypothetical protein ACK5C5_09400 [Bacteroidota bacterium]